MTQRPVCLKLYKSELEDIKNEIARINRLRTVSQLFGLSIAAIGFFSFFFPHLLSRNITIDNLSKFSSIFLGGIFFASINFFNKPDLLNLYKKRNELEIFIEEYNNYETKTELQRQKINDECEKIIQKRKGL